MNLSKTESGGWKKFSKATLRKGFIFSLIFLFLFPLNILNSLADDETSKDIQSSAETLFETDGSGYMVYYSEAQTQARPQSIVPIAGQDFSASESNESYESVEGGKIACVGQRNTWLEWNFNIEEAGAYAIKFDYFPLIWTGSDIAVSITIDGKSPFEEAENITLPRVWANENGTDIFEKDSMGNELRPEQVETPHLVSRYLQDTTGQFDEPYLFILPVGTHVIRVTAVRELVGIQRILLNAPEAALEYTDYAAQYKGYPDNAKDMFIEAEHAVEKSSSLLYPTYDRSTVSTTPNSPACTILNTIGGTNWKKVGDSLTWTVKVESSGWYKIAARVRQDYAQGMTSYRTLYIDGEVPFKQAENMAFPYKTEWYIKALGDDTPLLVYLEEGTHELSLEASAGAIAPILRDVRQVTLDLNAIYRNIIMVTGISPDIYRDYQLDKEIPTLEASLIDCRNRLNELSKQIAAVEGTQGTQASLIDQIALMLDDFIQRPYGITERLSNFQSRMESLGALLLTLGEQPLEMDSIQLLRADEKVAKSQSGWLSEFSFEIQKFLYSFSNDYTTFNGSSDSTQTIQVWVSTGRDQAQVISRLISEKFTPKTGIAVQLSLVNTSSTLIQAALAGKGPHAALLLAKEEPVNLAMRGGLEDLSKYGLDDIYDQFYESAWIPFRYMNGIYALPETQTFEMMFYRTDVFKELGISAPNTWDEFYTIMEKIQNANLSIGILEKNSANLAVSSAISMFDRFLFQNSGTYFNDNWSTTLFDEEVALNAFEKTVKLYTDYGLDQQFDFYNRFRSGEMVLSIQPYSMYNLLTQAAPEITGLWKMVPIPGTKTADGKINRAESSAGNGCVMLKSAVEDGMDKIVFDFLKWWVSGETQGQYSVEIESTMGAVARNTPANKLAFDKIAWSEDEKASIKQQWEQVTDVRQIPGNYVIVRSLTSALRLTISSDGTARKNLQRYNKDINSEITRKRLEFNLN